MRRVLVRAGGVAGVAGPAVFTAAWVAGSLRQGGNAATGVQISGLAAPDARDPWIMITGFLVLGGCTVAFGTALHDALGGRGQAGPAPRLIQGAGVLTVAAGLLRRDRMLLTPGPVSWHNQAHDVVSAVVYCELILVQLLLAARFGRGQDAGTGRSRRGRDGRGGRGGQRGWGGWGAVSEAGWEAWRPWLLGSAAATAAVLIPFGADTSAPWAGLLQRIAVTVPLAAMAAIAARLLATARPRSVTPLRRCRPREASHGTGSAPSAGALFTLGDPGHKTRARVRKFVLARKLLAPIVAISFH